MKSFKGTLFRFALRTYEQARKLVKYAKFIMTMKEDVRVVKMSS